MIVKIKTMGIKKITNQATAKRDILIKPLLHERLGEFAPLVEQYLEDKINYIPQQNYLSIHNVAAASMRFEVSNVGTAPRMASNFAPDSPNFAPIFQVALSTNIASFFQVNFVPHLAPFLIAQSCIFLCHNLCHLYTIKGPSIYYQYILPYITNGFKFI